jgi:hypothetical protein
MSEVKNDGRNQTLAFLAHKLDPIAGRIIFLSSFFAPEVFMDILRYISAKVGIWVAKMLFVLKDLSSSFAAHLYHTSRKVEAGEPVSHPSFFIKAIVDFKEKMKEGEDLSRK